MKDEEKTRKFAELYTSFKSKLVGHGFRLPKPGSKYWNELDAARKMVDKMGGNYGEFLLNEFKTYEFHSRGRRRRFYPAAKWLTLPATRARYEKFLKNRRSTGLNYSTRGPMFIVRKTGREYRIEQARSEVRLDEVANRIYSIAIGNTQVDIDHKLWEDCCYLIAKMDYRAEVIAPIVHNWIKENVEGVVDEKV